ncbi:hypothetical protein [Kamptonema formosum]|uniref:hypothetical protein n=1 Tax=Kamptonema formosum TaxID=331992 RepID=UPI00034D4EE3|nr:hypothetical protein [Kamptonema formosum]
MTTNAGTEKVRSLPVHWTWLQCPVDIKPILQNAASLRAIATFPLSPGEAGTKAKTLTNQRFLKIAAL